MPAGSAVRTEMAMELCSDCACWEHLRVHKQHLQLRHAGKQAAWDGRERVLAHLPATTAGHMPRMPRRAAKQAEEVVEAAEGVLADGQQVHVGDASVCTIGAAIAIREEKSTHRTFSPT